MVPTSANLTSDISQQLCSCYRKTLEIQSFLWQRNTYAQTALRNIEDTKKRDASLLQASETAKQIEAMRDDIANSLPKNDETASALYDAAKAKDLQALELLSKFEAEIKAGNSAAATSLASEVTAAIEAASKELSALATHMQSSSAALTGTGKSVVSSLIIFYVVYTIVYAVAVWIVGRILAKNIAFPMRDLEDAARNIALGDVEIEIHQDSKDEVGRLALQCKHMLDGIKEQARILTEIAKGDFSVSIQPRSEKDVVNIAIAQMIESNNNIMANIRGSSKEVSAGAQQIAHGAQGLATGSTEQAASVDEFSTTLHGVKIQTEDTAQAAQQVLSLTKESGARMEEGMVSMQELQQAMASIDESSQNITKMNKVIDDIAFQTNILALNAAVEAARAGQHGKGFAVVADEVRNLAAKSAAAAKETAALVEGSSQRVREGHKIVQKTSQDINAVGDLSRQNLTLIQEIAQKSEQQASSISDLAVGLDQISLVIQSNSATAEESAAASEEMSAQATMLNDIVSRFKLQNEPSLGATQSRPMLSEHPKQHAAPTKSQFKKPEPAVHYDMPVQYSEPVAELPSTTNTTVNTTVPELNADTSLF